MHAKNNNSVLSTICHALGRFFDCSVHVNIELIEPSFLHLHNLFSTVARAADDDDKEVTEEEDGEMEKEGEKGKDDKSKRTECICVF